MDIDKIVSMAQSSQSVMSRRIVRSAMTPIIYVCLLAPFCFAADYLLKDDVLVSRILAIVGTMPILVACVMYCYFAIFKTDKLQSEDYQIRQELLQMISHKVGKIKVQPISIEIMTTPDAKAIEEAEGEEK